MAALASALLFGACAEGEAARAVGKQIDLEPAVTQPPDPVSGATQPTGVIDQARSLTCVTERNTLDLAIQAFTAVEGHPPASEDDLVGGYLRGASIAFDVSPTGEIVAAPGSTCV